MARADSTIRVNIVGDSKGLSKELKEADKGLKGLASNTKALLGAAALAGVGVAVTEFAQTALNEADRLGDATARLEGQLGDLSTQLIDTADQFSDLGLSAQDVLELEASVADTATALGVADPLIAGFADDVAATAAAVSLLTDMSPEEVVDKIGKAASGADKPLRDLGVVLDDNAIAAAALAATGKDSVDQLTDGELAAARYTEILAQLKPKLDDATSGNMDLEQAQAAVNAKFETLTGKIGAALEGPLNDLLGWILTGIEGWEMFADVLPQVEQNIRNLLGPLADVAQFLDDIISSFRDLPTNIRIGNNPSNRSRGGHPDSGNVTINVQPNAHDDTERAVVNALRDHNRRNGIL